MSSQSEDNAPAMQGREIRSYVLRSGRGTSAQQRAYKNLSRDYLINFANDAVNFQNIFENEFPVIAEIGFGMGDATAVIAAENPEKNYFGIEVHKPGIGKLLLEIEKRSLSNVRIIEHDATEVFEKMIPTNSLDGIHIFFPDPWPKKRHHKRRLVKRPFSGVLESKLKPGGYLYMVTDWEDYAGCALAELSATENLANTFDNYAPHQDWRPRTGFEKKGLAKNHKVKELLFTKVKL